MTGKMLSDLAGSAGGRDLSRFLLLGDVGPDLRGDGSGGPKRFIGDTFLRLRLRSPIDSVSSSSITTDLRCKRTSFGGCPETSLDISPLFRGRPLGGGEDTAGGGFLGKSSTHALIILCLMASACSCMLSCDGSCCADVKSLILER